MAESTSLIAMLKTIPDPRGRQGRQYPLYGILGMLLLAAAHGETSLRGMWVWATKREAELVKEPALHFSTGRLPGLSTVWYVLTKVPAGEIEKALQAWTQAWSKPKAVGVDGKTLRGSRRTGGETALQVITAGGQEMKAILGQREIEDGDELAAAIRLLEEIPVKGVMVSADANILKRPFVEKVVERGGGYIGIIKNNQPELRAAIEQWVGPIDARPPDDVQSNKGHGRRERREIWMVSCGELRPYLEQRFGWPTAQWCGWVRRFRKPLAAEEWHIAEHIWIAGAPFPLDWDAAQPAALLRGHWGIENGIFRVRDVTYDEDRLHGRAIGEGLSGIRNAAINLIRSMGYRYIPDGQRTIAAMPRSGLHLLTQTLIL